MKYFRPSANSSSFVDLAAPPGVGGHLVAATVQASIQNGELRAHCWLRWFGQQAPIATSDLALARGDVLQAGISILHPVAAGRDETMFFTCIGKEGVTFSEPKVILLKLAENPDEIVR